jgi:uncharacterized membrane protein HdeD (DUF308 family)
LDGLAIIALGIGAMTLFRKVVRVGNKYRDGTYNGNKVGLISIFATFTHLVWYNMATLTFIGWTVRWGRWWIWDVFRCC